MALAAGSDCEIEYGLAELADGVVFFELLQVKFKDVATIESNEEGVVEMPDAGDHAQVVFEVTLLLLPQQQSRPIGVPHRYPLAIQAEQTADVFLLDVFLDRLVVLPLKQQLIVLHLSDFAVQAGLLDIFCFHFGREQLD